jgi:trk system potassium uptake protein TrkA
MHVVIVGAGRIGTALAKWLVSAGHEIAVVEERRDRCSDLDEALGDVSVLGNATDASVLAKAGTNRAELFVATTGEDGVNLVVCQLAKHHFNALRSIAVVNNQERIELFGMAGIDVSIDVTELALARIQESLSFTGLSRLMRVSNADGRFLVNVKVPFDAGDQERRITDLDLPSGTIVSLVIGRDGSASVPNGDTTIRAGDELIAVTTTSEEEALIDLLNPRSEE